LGGRIHTIRLVMVLCAAGTDSDQTPKSAWRAIQQDVLAATLVLATLYEMVKGANRFDMKGKSNRDVFAPRTPVA
jgi:hypothetical protein